MIVDRFIHFGFTSNLDLYPFWIYIHFGFASILDLHPFRIFIHFGFFLPVMFPWHMSGYQFSFHVAFSLFQNWSSNIMLGCDIIRHQNFWSWNGTCGSMRSETVDTFVFTCWIPGSVPVKIQISIMQNF